MPVDQGLDDGNGGLRDKQHQRKRYNFLSQIGRFLVGYTETVDGQHGGDQRGAVQERCRFALHVCMFERFYVPNWLYLSINLRYTFCF